MLVLHYLLHRRSQKLDSFSGATGAIVVSTMVLSLPIIIIIINLPQTGKDKYKRCKPVQGTVQNTKITTKYNITKQRQHYTTKYQYTKAIRGMSVVFLMNGNNIGRNLVKR